jgi:regulator of sigma E protease
MQTFVASVFVFGLLIFAHELGHFLAARLSGIRVLELAIGFGPKLISRRKNETDYSLRLFPLGGFCRMLGENPADADETGNFNKKPLHLRAAVLAAGSFMNLLLSVTVFFIIFFFLIGIPALDNARLGKVFQNSPADQAGLQAGDEIISIDGEQIRQWTEVVEAVNRKPGKTIDLVVQRNGQIIEFSPVVELVPETERGMIGIAPVVERYQFVSSWRASFDRFSQVAYSMYQVISGQAPLDVTGPVGIIIVVGEAAQTGIINLLWLTGLISISLGLINLLPLPSLDGGRLLFLLIEAVRGKPLDPEKEGFVHFVGFALLILLILLVTYRDLIRWDIIP